MAVMLGVSAAVHAVAIGGLLALPAPLDAPQPFVPPPSAEAPVIPVAYFDVAPDPEPEVEPAPAEPPAEPEPELAAAPEPPPAEIEPQVDPEPTRYEPAPEPAAVVERDVPGEDVAAPPVEVAAVEPAEPPVVVDAAPEAVGASDDGVDTGAVAIARPASNGTGGGVAATAPGAGQGTGDGAPAARPSGNGEDLDGVRARYHRQLQRRVARLQNGYSPTLQRLMLEGTVTVSIELDDRGRIVAVRLAESSGDTRLDEYAIEQVERLRRLVEPPPELGLAARTIELPISYSLRG